jgi:hypothetical protein
MDGIHGYIPHMSTVSFSGTTSGLNRSLGKLLGWRTHLGKICNWYAKVGAACGQLVPMANEHEPKRTVLGVCTLSIKYGELPGDSEYRILTAGHVLYDHQIGKVEHREK